MTTTIWSSTDIADRLTKLLLMLSASNDGEVLAAARAIDRVLENEHRDWHDLVRPICATPAPYDPQPNSHYSDRHWRSAAEFCAANSALMNEWEQGFVSSILKWRRSPTQKQLDCLESIRQRVMQQQQSRR
jgi:hypothetical protein